MALPIFAVAPIVSAFTDAQPVVSEDDMDGYLMVFFTDPTHDLFMATSSDGYTFTAVNGGRPVISGDSIAEQCGIRDPHISRGPDGAFYLAMTDLHIFAKDKGLRDTKWERPDELYGWGNNRGLVLMKSFDLINWTRSNLRIDRLFPEKFGNIGCAWAPETTYDPQEGKMMIYFTMRIGNGKSKLYYAYTDDAFTTLVSEPKVLFEYPNPEIQVLDADITSMPGGKWCLAYVAQDGQSGIKIAVSDNINNGWEYRHEWVDFEPKSCEAPNVWKRIGEDKWVVMYDIFSITPHNFGFAETSDFKTFKHLGHFNEGVMRTTNFQSPKHGAVIPITNAEKERLESYWDKVRKTSETRRDAACRKQLIDDDWQFRLTVTDSGDSICSPWTKIDLPHDWSVLNDFDRNAKAGNDGAYLPAGRGEYRKSIIIPKGGLAGQHTALCLDGAYMNAKVSVNGKLAGMHPYGYTSVIYDITPYLHEGKNELFVSVDNSAQKNCRWYSGSGIYRHVWLLNTSDIAVKPWSVFITTPDVADDASSVKATLTVENRSAEPSDVTVRFTVIDATGKAIASKSQHAQVAAGGQVDAETQFAPLPLGLWSPDSPTLHTLQVELLVHGKVVDKLFETFGVRSISYSADTGFKLNGKPMLLNGSCVHHDNGMLGARSYDAAEARKVKLLKDAGFNAVRTSHNLPSPAFLDECDRQGLLVIDEAFDGWRESKTPHDYSELFDRWWSKDVAAMVLRDRNHPSIICWSIGNEIIERKKPEAVTTAHNLAARCRELDPTRPVTSALASWDSDWEIYDPLAAEHDIVGYNYMIHKAESDHARLPSRVMWQTESYPHDAFANWIKVNDNPYIIGDFVWTGIDYLGESGIGRHYYEGESEGEHYHRDQWPWHAAFCGDIDLLGIRKPISYYRDMLHNPAHVKLYMAVREPEGYNGKIKETLWGTYPTWESWNWPGWEGKPIEVEVISRLNRVRLYLNDKLIGEQPVTRNEQFRAIFTFPYAAGRLQACAVNPDGTETERVTIETAGKPVAVRLVADRVSLSADNQDLAFVTAEIVDSEGRVVPDATNRISFSVIGNGTIEATGSADIKDIKGYHHTSRKAWKGRAGTVVKSTHKAGTITLKAVSHSLTPAALTITTE